MKRLLVILAVFALLPLSARAASYSVGQHIHVGISNHPTDGHPVSGVYTFHVTVKLHDQSGQTTYIRLDDEHGNLLAKRSLVLGPCADCQTTFDWPINLDAWPQGRTEIRWHVDIPKNNEGNRQFTTSRTQLCVATCSGGTSDRRTPFNGGGSWYLGDYATVYLLSSERDIRPGGFVTVTNAQNADRWCVFRNPDMHHGSSGTTLGCGSGQKRVELGDVAIGDKIALYASQPNGNATVAVFTVGDGSDQAIRPYEFQSWWSHGGVILPPDGTPVPTPTIAPTPTPTLVPTPTPTPPTPAPSTCGVPG